MLWVSIAREKVKTWSGKGIKRFNDLRDLIQADRKSNKDFAYEFVAQQRQEMYDKEHKTDKPADRVQVANDLGSDTESESEVTYRVKTNIGKKDFDSEDEEEDDEEHDGDDNQMTMWFETYMMEDGGGKST